MRPMPQRQGRSRRGTPVLASLVLFLAAGCASELTGGGAGGLASGNDPLVGGPPIRPTSGGPGPAPAAPASSGGTVPPMTAPSTSGGPAALTSGGGLKSLDPNRDLRIGAPTSTPRGSRGEWTGTSSGVALDGPQPLTPGTPAPAGPRPGAEVKLTGAGAAAPAGYEALRAQLVQRGLVWMRMETSIEKGTVSLTCFVASRQSPGTMQKYEVSDVPDEVAALRAVLDRLDTGR